MRRPKKLDLDPTTDLMIPVSKNQEGVDMDKSVMTVITNDQLTGVKITGYKC